MAEGPKYGGKKADLNRAIAATDKDKAVIDDLNARTKKLGEAEAASADIEERAAGKRTKNTGARRTAAETTEAQAKAIEHSAKALTAEGNVLKANTELWLANARARQGAVAAGIPRAGGTLAGAAAGPVVPGSLGAGERYPSAVAGLAPALAATERAGATAEARIRSVAKAEQELAQASRAAAEAQAAGQLSLLGGGGARGGGGRQIPLFGPLGPYRPQLEPGPALPPYAYPGPGPVGPRTFVVPPGGLPAAGGTRTASFGGGRAAIGQYTAEEESAIRLGQRQAAILGTVESKQLAVNRALRLSAAEYAASSSALTRHGALSTEFIGALARGEVTLREFGGALTATIGKFGGWAVAGGLVYGAFEALKRVTEGAKATASGVNQLERAGLPNFSRRQAEAGFLDLSRKLNVPIGGPEGVAEAQFYATRAGFRNQGESKKVAETALEAQKLDQVPIQDSTKALGALKIAFGLNADEIHHVFEELDVGQLKFNARLNQTLPQLGRAAASVANSGGNISELTQQLITVVGATGGGGGTGGGNPATFFLREAGNLQKPTSKAILEEYGFDPKKGSENITKFNKELAERSKDLSPEARREIAKAIGGGTAIGGRYAITLLNAGPSGRLAAVEAEAGHPGRSVETDLEKKLSQFNEQAAAIGHTFERLGSQIGRIGLTTAAEDVITVLRDVGKGFEFVAEPAVKVGEVLRLLPSELQQVLLIAGAGGALTRFNRSEKGLGLSRPLSEAAGGIPGVGGPLSGFLYSDAKQFINRTKRALSEEATFQEKKVESAKASLHDATLGKGQAVENLATFRAGPGSQLVGATPAFLATDRGRALTSESEALNQAIVDADARILLIKKQATYLEQAQLRTKALQKVAEDSSLSFEQRRAELARAGVIEARSASGAPLIGPTGGVGVGYDARVREGASPGGVYGPLTKAQSEAVGPLRNAPPEAISGIAVGAAAEAATLAATAATAADIRQGGVEQHAAAASAADRIKVGGSEISLALQSVAASVRTGGAGLGAAGGLAKSGAGNVVAGAGIAAGGLFAGAGSKLLSAFFTAYIGSAIAEVIGGAVGGKGGHAIEGIGGDAAIGAGIGKFIPGLGVGYGAIAGAGFGVGKALAQSPLGAGYTRQEEEKIIAERRKRKDEFQEEQTSSSHALGLRKGKYPGIEALAEEEGFGGKAPGEDLENYVAVYSEELEKAFKDEGESAQKSKARIAAAIKNIDATLAVFGPTSYKGLQALEEGKAITKSTVLGLASDPSKVSQYSQILQEQIATRGGFATQQLQQGLATSTGRGGRLAAERTARNRVQEIYASTLGEPKADFEGQQADTERSRAALEARLKQLASSPATRGTAHEESKLTAQIKAKTEEITKLANEVHAINAAAPQLQASVDKLSNETGLLGFEAARTEIGVDVKRKISEAGGDVGKRKRAEQEGYDKTDKEAKRIFKGHLPPSLQRTLPAEQVEQREAKAREGVQEGLEREEEAGRRRLLGAGSDPVRRAQVGAANARRLAQYYQQHSKSGAFTWKQIEDAKLAAEEAQLQAGEAVANEAGQIAQARDYGNAIAQAGDQIRYAKTELERIQGGNALQAAVQAHLDDLGALAESKQLNPVEKDKTKIHTDRLKLRSATPDERIKLEAQTNTDLQKLQQDRVSETEEDINFKLHTQKIGNDVAIKQLKGLLRLKNLSKAGRRQIESQIYDLQNEGGNNPVYNIAPGKIKLPTAADVRRAIRGAAGAPQSLVHAPVTATTQNVWHIQIADSADIHAFADVLDRATHAGVRARLRQAGVR